MPKALLAIHTSMFCTSTASKSPDNLRDADAAIFGWPTPAAATQISTNLTGRSRRQSRSSLRNSQTLSIPFTREQPFPRSAGSAHASEAHDQSPNTPDDRSTAMSIVLASIARPPQFGRTVARRTGNKCTGRVECGRGSPEESL